jgi:hypothetical protein
MNERERELSDEGLGRRLASELPRYDAPARLRVAIADAGTPRPRGLSWMAPGLAAAATALVLVLFYIQLLPRIEPADPVQRLVRAVVSEHTRTLMWGTRRSNDIIPAALPDLERESGIGLNGAFMGDDVLVFVSAEPVYLERRRGVALHYRDGDGHLVTYIALPAPGVPVSDRSRVQIGRFKPALARESGFSTWVWKDGDLACFLVSDMVSQADVERFKDYFARVRSSTKPYPAY